MTSTAPNNAIDVFLQPGDLYFGDRETRIRTVLGSCVSLAFWHPFRHVGGMCHYMLPFRADRRMGDLDGRYADEAMAMLFREMRQIGTQPADYDVKIFGGANMFPDQRRRDDDDHVGTRNVETAFDIVKAHGLRCIAHHTAGVGHRHIIFDVSNGNVWVKHQSLLPTESRERRAGCAAPQALALAA